MRVGTAAKFSLVCFAACVISARFLYHDGFWQTFHGVVKKWSNPPLTVVELTSAERLRNQRPTLVVPPNISTSVKEIWIGNVVLLETLLVKFLPAPEPFRSEDALGWVWGFFIYLFVGSFKDPEQGGELFVSESWCNQEQEFYYKILLLLLDFRQRLLISIWIFDKGF